jgi:DNA-binding GntR family transcriptional regulator
VRKDKASTRVQSIRGYHSGETNLSLAQWVYRSLRSAIQQGQFRGGERMREEDVAQLLGVSRTPVREALSLLQAAGLLEMSPTGLVVATLTRSQVVELYAMREVLEGTAARFAAQHASATDVAALRQLAGMFAASLDSAPKLALINRELHGAIYVAAHNRYLQRTLLELHDALALLPSTTFNIPGRSEQAVQEHQRIIDAIERRDASAADQAARDHIRGAQQARLILMFEFPQAPHPAEVG